MKKIKLGWIPYYTFEDALSYVYIFGNTAAISFKLGNTYFKEVWASVAPAGLAKLLVAILYLKFPVVF